MSTRQPNSRRCFVCGLENPVGLKLRFCETAPGEVLVEYTVPEHFQGYPGVVHGGIVAAMLDEVAGRVHMSAQAASGESAQAASSEGAQAAGGKGSQVGETTRFMYTARLEVRYRKNVPVCQPLRIVGRAGKSKGRMATAASAIYTTEGELLAEADALLVDVPSEVLSQVDLEALGWKVYPEDGKCE